MFSRRQSIEEQSSDYEFPINSDDVQTLRSIGRKSINDFSTDDVKKSQKWAHKFWRQLGTKSPFFRAWFGDWRAYDHTRISVAREFGVQRGLVVNNDTGWNIQLSGKVFNETKTHKAKKSKDALPYLEYLSSIISNAILLDTKTGQPKSENTLFVHDFYAIADKGDGAVLLKLYVEEMNNPNASDTSKRAYKLLNIEKVSEASARVQEISPSSVTNTSDTGYTVADLFSLVKHHDANFQPRNVNPALLNEDGTPKVFHHGTRKGGFTSFWEWSYRTVKYLY